MLDQEGVGKTPNTSTRTILKIEDRSYSILGE